MSIVLLRVRQTTDKLKEKIIHVIFLKTGSDWTVFVFTDFPFGRSLHILPGTSCNWLPGQLGLWQSRGSRLSNGDEPTRLGMCTNITLSGRTCGVCTKNILVSCKGVLSSFVFLTEDKYYAACFVIPTVVVWMIDILVQYCFLRHIMYRNINRTDVFTPIKVRWFVVQKASYIQTNTIEIL